ncbi:MAG: histidine--tRNA ligase, partial [Methanobacteriota archaeon]
DFYPEEMAARLKVFQTIRETCYKYGFREIDSPAIEPFELFAKKSGEEIVNETYSFHDKGGRFICLRPELTPSIARMIISRQKELVKPVKWLSLPRLWRYERPQSGRLREFYQLNLDILGSPFIEADAEILCAGIDVLLNLGLRNFSFRISDRRLLPAILTALGENVKDELAFFRLVDKRDTMSEEMFRRELAKLGVRSVDKLVEVLSVSGELESVGECVDHVGVESKGLEQVVKDLLELAEILRWYGFQDYCEVDLSIVRGLDYYTGMVFEVYDKKKVHRALFGGGRYDNLIELLGGDPMPAVGFGMGDAVLELMMREEGVWPTEEIKTDYYVLGIGNVRSTVLRLVKSLRRDHVVEYDLLRRNISNQLRYADRINAEKVVFVGERDLAKGLVTVRDMATGEEQRVTIDKFLG